MDRQELIIHELITWIDGNIPLAVPSAENIMCLRLHGVV